MNNICRVCANRGNFCLPINTMYENMPISVVIQVICPIRIVDDDPLPKEICAECYNIVLNAYKLREKSLISDKLLRDKLESPKTSNTLSQQQLQLKRSRVDLDRSHPSPKSESLLKQATKKPKVSGKPSTSRDRRSTHDSSSLGEFPDSTNRSDDQSADEHSLLRKKQEDIINQLYEGLINPPLSEDPDVKPLRCENATCSNSHKLFESEDLLRIHKAFEHESLLNEPSKHSQYMVKPEVQSESYMKAFGSLCLRSGKVHDFENYHCKLCISKGVLIKFPLTTEARVLMAHVLSHLEGYNSTKAESSAAATGERTLRPKVEKHYGEEIVEESQDNDSLLVEQDVVDLVSDDEEFGEVNEDIPYEYATTKLGNLKLIMDGHSFAKKHDSATASYYKCIKRVSWRCELFVDSE